MSGNPLQHDDPMDEDDQMSSPILTESNINRGRSLFLYRQPHATEPAFNDPEHPWDPTQSQDEDRVRRERQRRQYEEQNPFHIHNNTGLARQTRSSSPSGLSLPIHTRLPLLDSSPGTVMPSPTSIRSSARGPVLPPINDMSSPSDMSSPLSNLLPRRDLHSSHLSQPTLPALNDCSSDLSSPTYHRAPLRDLTLSYLPHSTLTSLSDTPSTGKMSSLTTNHSGSNPASSDLALHDDDQPLPKQEQEQEQEQQTDHTSSRCEFSSPCRMTPSPDGMHYRKVVSHVFGRNKASTKLFPSSVWVHYCRKHYQRARYRADQWPFTQCELLLESLRRMEEWGGVESFELILRRREVMRVDDHDGTATKGTTTTTNLQTGRKHPTAVVSPVPDWLRQQVGQDMSFDDIRRIVLQVREYMMMLREEEKNRQTPSEAARKGPSTSTHASNSAPNNEPRQQPSRVRFPDVEILPTFRSWVLEAALRQRAIQQNDNQAGDVNEEDEEEESGDNLDDGDEETARTAEIGRAGSNTGQSASQRRRSERLFMKMVTRVSSRGAVKKPQTK